MKKSNELKQLNEVFNKILKSNNNIYNNVLQFVMINSTEFYNLQKNIKSIEKKLFEIIKEWECKRKNTQKKEEK